MGKKLYIVTNSGDDGNQNFALKSTLGVQIAIQGRIRVHKFPDVSLLCVQEEQQTGLLKSLKFWGRSGDFEEEVRKVIERKEGDDYATVVRKRLEELAERRGAKITSCYLDAPRFTTDMYGLDGKIEDLGVVCDFTGN